MSGQDDKTNCPNCGNSRWAQFKGFIKLPIIDEQTGETFKEIKFAEYKCELCKCT